MMDKVAVDAVLDLRINREVLLKPLHLITSAIDKKQALPILSNILFQLDNGVLSLVGTDLEVELVKRILLIDNTDSLELAIPAKKLYDICRALPAEAEIRLSQKENQLVIRSGKSRFVLLLIAATDFPSVEKTEKPLFSFVLQSAVLRRLFDKTSFSMAQQDVRYFLNGLLLDLFDGQCTAVATDGHRLSTSAQSIDFAGAGRHQVLVPRKAVFELTKLIESDVDELLEVQVADNYISISSNDFSFTSKLIDGQFPEYRALIPKCDTNIASIDRQQLKSALARVAILSNEKCRGAWLTFCDARLVLQSNNPDKDEAEDELVIHYSGPEIRIGCNINYLIDVMNVIDADMVNIYLGDVNSSILIASDDSPGDQYVVMPMCL